MMSKKYQHFLFDWDGCLADTPGVWMETYLRLYRAEGLKVEMKDVIAKSWGNLEEGPKNFGISNPEKFWEKIVTEVGKGLRTVKLHEGAKELLERIKTKVYPEQSRRDQRNKIAIVTSSPAKLVKPALEHHGLNQYIDAFVSSDDVVNEKPDPEMLYLALEKLDAPKQVEQSIVIGDTDKDIVAGQRAGMDQALILHELNKRFYDFEKLRKLGATYEVESLDELGQILL